MTLSAAQLTASLDHIAAHEPAVAATLARIGYPEPRGNPRGAGTMMRAIVGQQVSVKAAASIWTRLEAACGGDMDDHGRIAETPVDVLRSAGLSGQKASYVLALAQAIATGGVDFGALPQDDEDAIRVLTAIKGIGRWSAEIYLLFAEGRPDVFPAGDLAVQIELGKILGLDARPTEKATRALAEPFPPHRGALAVFLWHSYNINALGVIALMITDISSPANPVFKSLKSLADKKARREQGLFLAEGLRVCTEALATGHVPTTLIFAVDAESHPLTQALIEATEARRGTVLRASRDLLHRLTGKDNPGAVAAAYPIPDTGLAGIDRASAALWVVAENLKDPGNLGTMLRTCDATGAGGVILLDQSCDPFSLEAVRASMGGLFTRAVAQASGPDFFAWLRGGPGELVGAALDGHTVDYRAHRFAAPSFLFMGNEQSGLPPAYAAQCDALVKLPMKGTADSLNVAVATAVLLYEALGQLEPPAAGA